MNKLPVFFLYIWTVIHIGRPQDIFPLMEPYHPGDIIAGLAIVSFILFGRKDQKVFHLPEMKLFLSMAILAVILTPFSYWLFASTKFINGFVLKAGIYFYLVAKLLTDKTRVGAMMKAVSLSGILMAVATMLLQQPGVRASVGPTYDPNSMALLMVVTLPLALTQALVARTRKGKLFWYGGALFALLALIATQSRGGFLGLIAVGIYILKAKMPGLPKRRIFFLAVVFSAVFIANAGQEYKMRLKTIFEDVSSQTAGSARILVWQRGMVLFLDHPLLGVGPFCFPIAYGHYLEHRKFEGSLAIRPGLPTPNKWSVAHNSYLQVLVELGIFGLIFFLLILTKTFRNIRTVALGKNSPVQNELVIQARGMEISLFGWCVGAFFLSQAYSIVPYLFLFLSGSMVRIMSMNNWNEVIER